MFYTFGKCRCSTHLEKCVGPLYRNKTLKYLFSLKVDQDTLEIKRSKKYPFSSDAGTNTLKTKRSNYIFFKSR